MSSFRDLEIYQLAFDYAIEAHHLSLKLPDFEKYEQGSQLRRSTKRIKDTIAEGYGRRRYKPEFIRYLIFAQASGDEACSQLETLEKLYGHELSFKDMLDKYEQLGRKINKYIQYVEKNWRT